MADEFLGLQMLVTLHDPPVRLKGIVTGLEAGNSLTLTNVWFLDTKQWQPTVTIQAHRISDISQVPDATPTPPAPPKEGTPSFVDPAILSLGKQPKAGPEVQQAQPNTSEKRDPRPVPASSVPLKPSPLASQDATPTGEVTETVKGLTIGTSAVPAAAAVESNDENTQEGAEQEQQDQAGKKRTRRGKRGGRQVQHHAEDAEDSPQAGRGKAAGRGKGWRETPILESTSSFQPFKALKKNGVRGRQDENGWASEDVTDVQEMGEFDFEGNLTKFDKKQIFEQMRKDDQVDDADRLVSHNRQRTKPGAGGVRNLHYSENVLDLPATGSAPAKEPSNDFWNSEADDGNFNGGERLSGRDLGSRQGSRRGESKVSTTRRSQSRKASTATVGQGPNRVNSGVSHVHNKTATRSRPSGRFSTIYADVKIQFVTAPTAHGFYLQPSNRRLETVSALQMLNLENIAHNELGFTEDMMTENSGRGIAEVTLTTLTDPAIKVRTAGAADPSGNTPPSTVVILAGNNKSGIRAVAAARHLRNKNVNVLVCVVGVERGERDLLEDMRQQLRLFRNFGGKVFSKIELFEHLRKVSIPTLTIDAPRTSLSALANPAPVTLIIDALLGMAVSFEELRTGDQATVYELIEWANRNEAFVLSVDVPTGIDPSTGKVSIIDGGRLYVKPRYVVAIGAPKRGLLEVVAASDNDDAETISPETVLADDPAQEWRLFLVDMGLGAAVWKKAGTKIRRGIDFENKWVLEMKYQGAPVADDD